LTLAAMTGMFLLYEFGVVRGILWYPFYFFTTVLFFSAGTLVLFKKA
jgi:hypothetical protein